MHVLDGERIESPDWLEIRDLGRMPYREALSLQRSLQAEVAAAAAEGIPRGLLLLVEHDPPVITVSRRPGAAGHVLADDARLAAVGVERCETDRGGDVTYHGPGQLVAYPIVDLRAIDLRIHGWIRLLEAVVIDVLADHGIDAGRDPGATGVWVGRGPADPDGRGGRKIAALGVRVSRWITMHGLALNVDPDLSHFDLIVPCGLVGRPVTSMAREAAGEAPSMARMKVDLARALSNRINATEAFRESRDRGTSS